MSIAKKALATTFAVGAIGSGVGAYKEHEIANKIDTEAETFSAAHHDPTRTAEIKGLARTEETKAIELLGIALLLGSVAGGAYFDDKHGKPKPVSARKARVTS